MTARRLLVGYATVMAVLGLLYYLLQPLWRDGVWLLIGLTSSAAVLVGVAVNRPRRKAPWVLLSLATLAFIIGDTSYQVLTDVLHQENPYPSFPEIFYQIYYLLLVVALVMLPHALRSQRDRTALLDALTVTGGFGLLAWVFLISPQVRNPELPLLTKVASTALPLWDVLLLAVLTRFVGTVRRSWTVRLVFAGLVGLLVSDVLFVLGQVNETWQVGGPVDLGWFALYACTGAAALHPSMVALTPRETVWQTKVSWPRLVGLTMATLIPPVVLFVEVVTDAVRHGVMIAVTSATMFLLVAGRLAQVVRRHQRALQREQGLREAGAALVRAASVDDVRVAVDRAVRRPVGSSDECRVLLVAGAEEDGSGTMAAVARASDLQPSGGDDGATKVVAAWSLGKDTARRMEPFDTVLVRPLVVSDPVQGFNLLGALAVAARYDMLLMLRDSVEVLGFQASLALERISLDIEVDRRNSEEYFRSLVGSSKDVIVIIDETGRIRNASPTATAMFGSDVVGADLLSLVDPGDRQRARSVLDAACEKQFADGSEWRLRTAVGQSVHVEVSCRDLRGDRAIHGLVVTLRDVTARHGLERELSHRASHDALTGLANRDSFKRLMHDALVQPSQGPVVGALQIGLDDFKVINDTLGHDTGDRLLITIAHRISDSLGEDDLAARLGGDEFAVLVSRARDPGDVDAVAERVVAVIAEPIDVNNSPIQLTASVGVATSADAADAADLLRQADLALVVAKTEGKNRWRRYHPQRHESVLEHLEMRRELAEALQGEQLSLMFQPIAELRTGRVLGLESLARWHHPTRGTVVPDRFIPIAEESGQIARLGAWVLHHSLVEAVRLRNRVATVRDLYVSVNVSAGQFRTPGFAESVYEALDACELPAAALVLEITESLFLQGDEQVSSDLAGLRRAGVRIAIDDFGTGYSSLSYLHRVPVDIIKIDRSFVDGITSDPQRRKLVDGILRLATSLELETVAEGVETEPDRDLLINMGCRLGQGYLYAKPLDPGSTERWLTDHATPTP